MGRTPAVIARAMLRPALVAVMVCAAASAHAEGPAIGTPGPSPPPPSPCVSAPETAEQAVRDVFDALGSVYKGGIPGPMGEQLRAERADALAKRHVDVAAFAAAVLRVAWEEGTEEMRERWSAALGALLHERYMERLKDPRRHRIEVNSSVVTCDTAKVHATLRHVATGDSNALLLRLVHRAGVWRAWDVRVDDVSLVEIWRSRFQRFYRQGGLVEVDRQLAKMAKRFGVAESGRP